MRYDTVLSSKILLAGPAEAAQPVEGLVQGQPEWWVVRAASAGEAMWRLRQERDIDVVIVAPGERLEPYTDLTRHVKFGRSGEMIPVVFLLEASVGHLRGQIYAAGADDCIQLPAPREEILLRVLNAVRMKQATDSLENATAVITSLAHAIEGRDAYTCGHVERVATYATEIAKRVGVGEKDLWTVRIGAMVHDIGKVIVPDQILNKAGRLTEEEMEIVKRHPVVGYEILMPLRTMQEALPIVRWHHERPNGRGYPDGICGDDVPLFARIVAVADCFDALATNRPYRAALSVTECQEVLGRLAGDGDLAPEPVAALREMLNQDSRELAQVVT